MLFAWLLCAFLFVSAGTSLWPLPKSFIHGFTVLWLQRDLEVVYRPDGPSFWKELPFVQSFLVPGGSSGSPSSLNKHEIDELVEQFQTQVFSHAFVPWKFHPREAQYEPKVDGPISAYLRRLIIERASKQIYDGSKEAYILKVTEDGDALIQFNHAPGIIHALTTLSQLFNRHSDPDAGIFTKHAPLEIQDTPSFAHRGLNLDISRNVISCEDVKRTIRGLALNKFNRLHLHATDAQSWPIEIPSLPELASKGAYHSSQIWSVSDLEDVQSFGAKWGVEVYLEIDMPGHTASVQESYPHLITSFNRKPWVQYSAQPPPGQLKLQDKQVDDFIRVLLDDLLPRIRPFSPLFHLGGDEITASAYNMTADEVKPHLQAFLDHAIGLVHSHSLIPVVWEEHLLDYNLSLPTDAVVQAWRGANKGHSSALAKIVQRGHKALFGSNDHWYLDCGHGNWVDRDLNNPKSPIKSPYMDYCAPLKNWREVYSYEPLSDVPLEQQHLVLGGELHMWAEQTDGYNLDRNLWPRVAAAGEVLWSGKGTVSENATRRLAEMREWLVSMDIAAEPVQVTWCLMNPGNCIS